MANINSIKLPDGVTYDIDGKTVNGFTVEKAVPSNAKFTDTNTKVTSVSNHYAPAEDSSAQLSADASGGSDATPGTTQLVTGVDVKRDAKGHVVGLDVDSIKLPSYPTVGTAAAKNYTTSVTSGSGDLVTSGAVYTAIANLPEPMVFKGTLGTGGTITSLPTAAAANEGFTYKVITAGTYASQAAKVGDLFISNGSAWVLVPSGDDTATDTWRNIKVNGTEKLGSGISTGAVDFVNGTNTTVSFNSTGNKVSINATDTNDAVTQTATSTDANYEVLFSNSANNTTETAGARKDSGLIFNPSKDAFTAGSRKSGSTVGAYSTALGYDLTASGNYSHAEGDSTTASGNYSHAEGSYTTASGSYSHAEGSDTTASGSDSHAEGSYTTASGRYSHTEGLRTTASGYYSHAEGFRTTANHKSQHVFGEYSIDDPSTADADARGNYIEIVGNGTATNARSNARTLDWSGNEWLAGNLNLGGATSDIVLSGSGNTWDGTNTSLKTALAAAGKTYTATTTSIGSASAGTAISADDITAWSAGTVPTLGTAISADDITAWSANTPTSCAISQGVLTFTAGSAASLSYTSRSIPNVTSVGTAPSLSYTSRSIPNISVTATTVATGITES